MSKIDYEITIDARGFSDEKKKRVQDAFFKLGVLWCGGVNKHKYLDAIEYTNKDAYGAICINLMRGNIPEDMNVPTHTFNELMELAGMHEHIEKVKKSFTAKDATVTIGHISSDTDLQEAIDATCSNITMLSEGLEHVALCNHLASLLKEQRKRLGVTE